MTATTETQRPIFSPDLERTFQKDPGTPMAGFTSLRGRAAATRHGPHLRPPLPTKLTGSRSQQLLVLAMGAGFAVIAGLFAYQLLTKIITALAPAPFLI